MFTLQWAQIEQALREGGISDIAIAGLAQLGNCVAELQHRGPVQIQQEWPNAPDVEWAVPMNNTISVLKASNPFGQVDGDKVKRGWAGFFEGPVNIRGDLIIQNLPGGGPNNGGNIFNHNNITNTTTTPTALYIGTSTGTITALSGSSLGTGSADIYTVAAGLKTTPTTAITALNPFEYTIPSGTNLIIGKLTNAAGPTTTTAYVVMGINSPLRASQFDITSSEPTLLVDSATIVPFDTNDVATTNSAKIALTATAGQIKCFDAGTIEVSAKVLGKRDIADANINIWYIWLQKSVDNGSTWSHVLDSMACGPAYNVDCGISLIFTQQLQIVANTQIRVVAAQRNGSSADVKIVSQLQPSIDGATLHFGSKLNVKYLEVP